MHFAEVQPLSKLNHYTYFLIICIVFVFNLIAVYGSQVLLHDEPSFYYYVLIGFFPWWMLKFNLVLPFTEWAAWNILAFSPFLARGLYIVFLMIPLSLFFYNLYYNKFGFSRVAAVTAAVLPAVLPMQYEIPAGINMSYVLWGLSFAVLSLTIGLNYLESSAPLQSIWLGCSALCYLIATQIMELALFMAPPLILLWIFYRKSGKKQIYISLIFSMIGLSKFIQMIIFPRKFFQLNSVETIITRIMLYFQWGMPFPDLPVIFSTAVVIGIIIWGYILWMKTPIIKSDRVKIFLNYSPGVQITLFYSFFIVWSLSSILPSIFLSPVYRLRYAFIPLYGTTALMIYSIEIILEKLFPAKNKYYFIIISILILLAGGTSRFYYLKMKYAAGNEIQSIIIRDLKQIQLPFNSQIVITKLNKDFRARLDWAWSSGYYQFALKRKDLSGLLIPIHSNEYQNFGNPFHQVFSKQKWGYSITMLALDKPLFIFYFDDLSQKLVSMRYVLQWRGEKMDVPWTIYQCDISNGKISPWQSGTGMDEYQMVLEKMKQSGIRQATILWGGPPTDLELKRLKGIQSSQF